jgi:hypothetical protein
MSKRIEYFDIYEQQTIGHVVEAIAVFCRDDGQPYSVSLKFDGRTGDIQLLTAVGEELIDDVADAILGEEGEHSILADLTELYLVNRELGTFIPELN